MERLPYLLTVVLTIIILLFFDSISQAQTSFNVSNKTTGDTLFTIDNRGKVGIGTTAPGAKLEVLSTDPDQNSSFRLGTSDLSNYIRLYSGRSTLPNPFIMWNSGSDLRFGTAFAEEYMRLTGAGNLGMGTTAPGARLHLVGDGFPNSFMYLQAPTGQDAGFRFYEDATPQWHIYNDATSGGLRIQNNAWQTALFADQSTGNVGIGTTEPSEMLEVAGTVHSTSGGFRFPDGSLQATAALGGSSTWQQNGSNIYFNTGNVGIGTTTPVYPLSLFPGTNESGIYIDHNQTETSSVRGIWIDLDRTGTGNGDAIGVYSSATNNDGGWNTAGIYGTADGPSSGAKTGVYGLASGSGTVYGLRGWANPGTGTTYGVHAVANGSGISSQYGVYGSAQGTGTGTHYGVYGTTSGGGTNHWAGYFDGNTHVGGNLGIGTATPSEMLEVADTIYSTVGGFKFPDNTVQTTAAVSAAGGYTLDQAYDQGGPGSGRTIIADNGAVTIEGTDGFLSTGIIGSGIIPIEGEGARMMWYPAKAAFRAGHVYGTRWDDVNIGINSFAVTSSIASGNLSIALGGTASAELAFSAIGGLASGEQSISLGVSSESSGFTSVSIGQQCITYGDNSSSFGSRSTSNQQNSTAIGYESFTNGIGASAFGHQSNAVADYALAMGNGCNARGVNATAIGSSADADGDNSISLGGIATGEISFAALGGSASGDQSIAIGSASSAEGLLTISIGNQCTTLTDYSSAIGPNSSSLQQNSTAVGYAAFTDGVGASAFGYQSNAVANYALAMGNGCNARGVNATAIGYSADADGDLSVALGGVASAELAFSAVGGIALGQQSISLGVNSRAEGAFSTSVGQGSTNYANYSSSFGYNSSCLQQNSTAIGYQAGTDAVGATAIGNLVGATGDYALAIGYSSSASGNYSTAIGPDVTISGAGSFITGDNSPTAFSRSGDNTFYARFANGYNLYTNDVCTLGVSLGTGGTSWSSISDSTKKENFKPINGESFLNKIGKMKLTSWNFKGQDPTQYRHYGPMAQDFYTAFGNDGIGTIGNDTTIASADFDGVNLIAIQALEKRTSDNKQFNEELKNELNNLKEENLQLKQQLHSLALVVSELKTVLTDYQNQNTANEIKVTSMNNTNKLLQNCNTSHPEFYSGSETLIKQDSETSQSVD